MQKNAFETVIRAENPQPKSYNNNKNMDETFYYRGFYPF